MVLSPSESCTLSSDNGLPFPAVSFHSAGMVRDLSLSYRTRTQRVAPLKYSLWPGNFFSLWYFSQLFWAQPCYFFILTCLHPVFGSRLSDFQAHAIHAFQTSIRSSMALQTVATFHAHNQLTQACPSCARNEAGVL